MKLAGRTGQLTLVAHGLDSYECQKNVIRFCMDDFKISAPAKATLLEKLLQETRVVFDEPITQGFRLVLQNEKLMTHYWRNEARMLDWAGHLGSPEAQMDLESLFGVPATLDFAHLNPPQCPISDFPVLILFAEHDSVINRTKETALVRILFQNMRDLTISGTGHFLHLEQPEEFVRRISKEF